MDAMVGHAIKSHGGFVWACKNYDGDVQSDFVAQSFGLSSLMWSVLRSGDGRKVVSETVHGALGDQYRRHVEAGHPPDCCPVSTIFAWTRGLSHLAGLEANKGLEEFCRTLEGAAVAVVEGGCLTRDLADVCHVKEAVTTEEFVKEVVKELDNRLGMGEDSVGVSN